MASLLSRKARCREDASVDVGKAEGNSTEEASVKCISEKYDDAANQQGVYSPEDNAAYLRLIVQEL